MEPMTARHRLLILGLTCTTGCISQPGVDAMVPHAPRFSQAQVQSAAVEASMVDPRGFGISVDLQEVIVRALRDSHLSIRWHLVLKQTLPSRCNPT
jgi:hypothetical protein